MYTLFQVMTLENWSMGIVRPVMEQYPYTRAFFTPFIPVELGFTVLAMGAWFMCTAIGNYVAADHLHLEPVIGPLEAGVRRLVRARVEELVLVSGVVEVAEEGVNVVPAFRRLAVASAVPGGDRTGQGLRAVVGPVLLEARSRLPCE